MSEYIKLEDAIEVCRENQIIEDGATTGIRYPSSKEITIELLELPTIEIVRCKNCKHWGGVILGNKCTMLSGLDYVLATKENDFCSFGERKESEE